MRYLRFPLTFLILFTCVASNKEGEATPPSAPSYEWEKYDNWYYKKTKNFKGWKYIVLHHSATEAGSVKAFDRFHTDQGYGGIAYHFVIGNGNGMRDGEIKSTFRWQQQIAGTHVSVNSWEHNVFGIGICLVGNLEKIEPTPAQKKALDKLVKDLRSKYGIAAKNVLGHSQVPFDTDSKRHEQTLCPGKKLTPKRR